METRLVEHINSITNSALQRVCDNLLHNDKFHLWPASLSFHHAYEGGLLAHTVEVCDIALGIAGLHISGKTDGAPQEKVLFSKVDRDILLTAALWHDFCKVEEYRSFWEWSNHIEGQSLLKTNRVDESGLRKYYTYTDYGKTIHHISGSAIEFSIIAASNGVSKDIIGRVQHCILAHHGRCEWGSPVEPQTVEALLLHQADMLSAKFGSTKSATE